MGGLFKRSIATHTYELIFLAFLVFFAFFLRSYALYRDIVFAYDQGRDAIEVQRILDGNLTLIGPTTGLSGVFLGPVWYYILTPLYLIGRGNPMVPAYFFVGLHSLSVVLLYYLAKKCAGPWAGVIASLLFVISFTNIMFARWLSNPTPLPFFSLLLFSTALYAMERRSLILSGIAGVILGMCIQMEAANAVWFIATILVFVGITAAQRIHNRKNNSREIRHAVLFVLAGIAGFTAMLLPQILFEIRHGFLSTHALLNAFTTTHEETIAVNFPNRAKLLFTLFARGIFPNAEVLFSGLLLFLSYIFVRLYKFLFEKLAFILVFLWLSVPLFFHSIYNGNHGNFWDYYMIAQHIPLYILTGSILATGIRLLPRIRIVIIIFTVVVIGSAGILNFIQWRGFLHPYVDRFSLSLQIESANFLIDDANGTPYGVWVYTPSAQDESHRYVFDYVGKKRGVIPQEHAEQQSLIYLVVEDDPGYAKRREEWITDKEQFGQVTELRKFGAITVYKIHNTMIQ